MKPEDRVYTVLLKSVYDRVEKGDSIEDIKRDLRLSGECERVINQLTMEAFEAWARGLESRAGSNLVR